MSKAQSLHFLCMAACACCAIAAAGPALAEPEQRDLGRIFFSAERRAALDRMRQLNVYATRALQGESLRLDGVVQRAGGKSTVWINGRPQTEGEAAYSGTEVLITPRLPGQARIAVGNDSSTDLKVGEAINRSTGERDTRLGQGSVSRHSRP